MATLHLIHGFVGVGKTTYARQLEKDTAAIRFTHDEWMVRLYGHNPPEDAFADYDSRVAAVIWDVTIKLLALGTDVILDFGFWSRAARDEARAIAQAAQAEVKLHFITCSEEVMRERVATRNSNLPADSLWIDEHAFEAFKQRYEALGADEPHMLIRT